MARPAKSINVMGKHLTQEEIEARGEMESALKGKDNSVKPFDYLTLEQIKIFRFLVKELKASGVVGNLDVYLLNKCAVTLDRLNQIDREINENPKALYDDKYAKARREYTADFNKCCSELCLSPQARAKMGTLSLKKKEEAKDPLLRALKGG